jgi:hypothetical protein
VKTPGTEVSRNINKMKTSHLRDSTVTGCSKCEELPKDKFTKVRDCGLLPFSPEPSVFFSAVKNVKIRMCKTIIFPVVLYGCETWSLSLREDRLLRIFGPKRDEVMRGWRKLHNKKLHDLYSSPSMNRIKSRRMRWAGHVVQMGRRGTCIGYW